MNTIVFLRRQTIAALLITSAALLYVVKRACTVSLTWDEAYTWFEFVKHPAWLRTDLNTMSANNHLLNTWLMKLSTMTFGTEQWALRLPNLLMFPVFAWLSFSVTRKLVGESWWGVTAFSLIIAHPYLLDQFSMARGYGIGLALQVALLWKVMFHVRADHWISAFTLWMLVFFSLMADLNLLWMALAFLLYFIRYGQWRQVVAGVVTLVPFILYSFRLRSANAFYLGDPEHSLLAIFASWGETAAYAEGHAAFVSFNVWWIYAQLLASVVLLFIHRQRIRSSAEILLWLFTVSVVLVVLAKYILGLNIPTGRTSVHLLLLFLMVSLVAMSWSGRLGKTMIIIFAGLQLVNITRAFNLQYFHDTPEQQDVRTAAAYLLRSGQHEVFAEIPFDLPLRYYGCTVLPEGAKNDLWRYERAREGQNCTVFYPSSGTGLVAPGR